LLLFEISSKKIKNMQKQEMKSDQTNNIKNTVIQIYGTGSSECGYCKSKNKASVSFGVVSNSMRAEDYESLMLIGWRRSGRVRVRVSVR
jgi:arginyl-tRNA--protein-N-Asp/Glu arginylyltransferase